jgi:energy-coupling factor transporter transmembrane protein EcfT
LTKALGGVGLLGVFYFLSACIFLSNNIILIILIFGFILAYLLYGQSRLALMAALLVAIAGTAAEISFVHVHWYYYSRPQIMGVTYWLPFLYGIASITTGQLARVLAGTSVEQSSNA